ncbi:Sodium-dependent dicarboxylate transporter SdcS [Pelotomaculum schinkii]|uniref:Sodium-dependent dicarboxylate transporter SdcS n=1 Tax=Pelotomaculum schinkii TaxID=78350 RepID=A0A4Y7R6F7_9FIRM|nr:DASS family sodium-coupled anion symporter [Pelotomaculum schinkii]TEB04525.1 Sodium-dependent dicarboxylate transporter SdcS [Pelotomaculum schinkii]
MDKTQKQVIWVIGLIILYFILSSLPCPAGLEPIGLKAIALMVVVVITWITEVVPIAMSALLFVFLQALIGITDVNTAVANFATPTLLFVLSSFFLAFALEFSGLSNRISMKLTVLSGGNPKKALLYLMVATALVSTVISDVPACAAFFPIGLALLKKNNCLAGSSNFGKSMMIGIPFASLIGGVATPAGSSLNVLAIGLLKSSVNIDVTFTQWSGLGIPFVIVTLPLTWLILSWVFKPEIEHLEGIAEIEQDYKALGPITAKEVKFIVIFLILLVTWFTEGKLHSVPIAASTTIGAVLFFLPGIDLLTWDGTKNKIGWNTILLIGAASSLGTALWKSGAAAWLAQSALQGIAGASMLVVVLFVVIFTILIHLLVPVNPAIVSIMVPSLAAFAATSGMSPALLIVPMAFTVSSAMLIPLDPVPLITYPSGYYNMKDFFKGGCPASILWAILMTIAILVLAGPVGLI